MFHREYPIKLRDGIPPERIALLRKVLERAPDHIPGFLESVLVEAPEGSSHDLVWRNVFRDVGAFWLYAGHPYHANLINDHLAPDAPNSMKAAGSTGSIWTDDGPVDLAEMSDLFQADAALEAAGISASEVHLHEHIDVVPGRSDDYLRAVEEIYLPAASRHGMRLLMTWRSPDGTGEHQLVFVWSVAGWGAAFRNFAGISNEVDMMEQWLATVRPLRTGGRRRYLLPTELAVH